MTTFGATRNGYRLQIQCLAGALLAAGVLTIFSVLYFGEIKAQFPFHAVMLMEVLLTFLTGTALLAVVCFAKKWTRPEQGRIWLMLSLGIGLIFIYAAADVADNFLVAHSGYGLLELYKEICLLLGATVLVSGSVIWIRELLRTRQQLLLRERKLRESESKFRALFDFYPDATLLIDTQTELPEQFNHVACEQLGYTSEEFSRLKISEYEAKETPEDVARHIAHVARHGRDDFETLHRRKDGSLIDVHVTVILLHLESKPYLLCVFRDISDKKDAIRSLEQSEQRFRDVTEAAGEYIWEIDRQGAYSFITRKVENLLGRKVEEILGRSPFEFMPPDEAQRVERLLAGWAERGESWQGLEHQSVRADGQRVWQRVSGLPILDAAGKLIGFRGTALDITTEKEARLAEQMMSERLNLATQSADLAIWDYDLESGRLEWDERMFRIYGVQPSDFRGNFSDWSERLLPDSRKQAVEAFQTSVKTGQTFQAELSIRRANDGAIRVLQGHGLVFHDETGKPIRVVGINRDITERVEDQRQLAAQEAKFRGLFELAPVGIAMNDFETGEFLEFNEAISKPTGYSREELRKLSYFELTPEEYMAAEQRQRESMNRTGRYGPYEKEYIRKDGSRYPVLLHGFKTADTDGRAVIWSIIQDISEAKKAEAVLRDERRRLAGIIEGTNVGTWEWNVQTGETIFNERWAEIIGYSLEEISPTTIGTWTGFAHPDDLQDSEQALTRHFSGELLNLTAGEAPDVLRALPPESLVLRLNNLLDGRGGFLSIAESMNVISAQSPVPVFTLWDFDLGLGALGGIVVSGFEQGRQAGELAGRILGGASVDRIPVVMQSPNVPMFDFQQMERFGLSKRDLPASALILNKPLSMLDEFKVWFWVGVLIVGLLAALILVLLTTMTYRRKAAKILAESEKNLVAMFNAIPDSLLLVDPEGKVIAINSTAARRLGGRPEEMLGRIIYDFLPAEVADSRRLRMEQALGSGEPVLFEDQRDGRTMDSHLYPIRNNQGRIDRLFIFGQDITEHRSIQDALFRQKELLESISNVQDLFISGEEPGKVYQDMLQILVSVTESAYGFLDEALRDPDGTPYKLSLAMSDISWDEGSRSLYQQLVERKLEFRNLDNLSGAPVLERRVVIANNAPEHPRYRGLPKGHPPLSSFLGIPLFFKGEVIGVAGVANRPGGYDMNLVRLLAPLTKTCAAMIWAGRLEKRRRQAVEALRQSEERYRCIAETANEGFWVLGADYRTTFVNRHMAGMLGCTSEEMLGRPRDEFMFAEDRADQEERMRRRSGGRSEVYERRFRHKSGAEIWTIASATPLLDAHGRVIGSFAMFTDITERKAAEEELKATSQALQQALEEKNAFFSIIAHDLRSPISGLLGLTGLLIDEQGLSQKDLRTVSVEMARSVRTIFDLLENLLEWSRMQRGLTTFNPAPRDLLKAARDCAELARSAAEQKNVTLRLDVPEDCLVSADEHMLSAILRNLVFNALKFSHPGSAVTISAQPDRDVITVAVADEGVGMDEQTLTSLFSLHCKKSRLGTSGEKGTGLGLVLCKEFIEKHGGTIRAESRPGRGTTFFFTLPKAREGA